MTGDGLMDQASEHWQAVYRDRAVRSESWFRETLDQSLRLIERLNLPKDAAIVDIGAGRSTLVDDLLTEGFGHITLVDLSADALDQVRTRVGDSASLRWYVGSVLDAAWPDASFDLWHDRAVFHFLHSASERERYVHQARRSLRPGAALIIATFASDGPEKCSGLPVCRYDATQLAAEFAEGFVLEDSCTEAHHTPAGVLQPFTYLLLRRDAGDGATARLGLT